MRYDKGLHRKTSFCKHTFSIFSPFFESCCPSSLGPVLPGIDGLFAPVRSLPVVSAASTWLGRVVPAVFVGEASVSSLKDTPGVEVLFSILWVHCPSSWMATRCALAS